VGARVGRDRARMVTIVAIARLRAIAVADRRLKGPS
jgi:hypothetical protein